MKKKISKYMLGISLALSIASMSSINALADDVGGTSNETVTVEEVVNENADGDVTQPEVSEDVSTEIKEQVIASDEDVKDGWEKGYDNYTWYYYRDGKLLSGGPHAIDGKQYIFDSGCCLVMNKTVVGDDNRLYKTDSKGVATVCSEDGWVDDAYYLEDGQVVYGLKEIDGDWYYFYLNGRKLYEGAICIDDVWYGFDSTGRRANGWFHSSANIFGTCYADPDGVIFEKGWKTIDGSDYYFVDYNPKYGFAYIDGECYHFNKDGKCTGKITTKSTWLEFEGEWYYVDENGKPVISQLKEIGGKTYCFRYNGSMVRDYYGNINGIIERPSYRYGYIDKNGVLAKNKWVEVDINDWQYFDDKGERSVGWTKVGSKWYYFIKDGDFDTSQITSAMAIGDVMIGGKKYHFSSSGVWDGKAGITPKSWYKVNGAWRYCQANGKDAYDLTKIGNDTYYFSYNGDMIYGRTKRCNDNTVRAFGLNGKMVKTGWFKDIDGNWAYVENEKAVTGLKVIKGKSYYFDEMGLLCYGPGALANNDQTFYEINASGEVVKTYTASGNKWVKLTNGQYLYSQDGVFLKHWEYVIDNNKYSFSDNGVVNTNYFIGNYGYYGASGKLQKDDGWYSAYDSDGSKIWYYIKDGDFVNSKMEIIDGVEYYFDWLGKLYSGVCKMDEDYYYFDIKAGGKTKLNFVEGWNLYNGNWYYMKKGSLITGSLKDGNAWYYFGSDYKMLKNTGTKITTECGVGAVFFATNGKLVKNEWKKWNGIWYYFDANGFCVTGEQTIDGKKYLFDTDGKWIK